MRKLTAAILLSIFVVWGSGLSVFGAKDYSFEVKRDTEYAVFSVRFSGDVCPITLASPDGGTVDSITGGTAYQITEKTVTIGVKIAKSGIWHLRFDEEPSSGFRIVLTSDSEYGSYFEFPPGEAARISEPAKDTAEPTRDVAKDNDDVARQQSPNETMSEQPTETIQSAPEVLATTQNGSPTHTVPAIAESEKAMITPVISEEIRESFIEEVSQTLSQPTIQGRIADQSQKESVPNYTGETVWAEEIGASEEMATVDISKWKESLRQFLVPGGFLFISTATFLLKALREKRHNCVSNDPPTGEGRIRTSPQTRHRK